MPWTIPARPTVGDTDWNAEQEAIWSSLKSFVDGLEGAGGSSAADFGLVPKTSGDVLFPPRSAVTGSNISGATGNAYPTLLRLGAPVQIDAMLCNVTTLEAASSIGVYLFDSDADGHPANKVASVEGISGATTGVKTGVLGSPVDLDPGAYWAFVRTSSPGGLIRYQAMTMVAAFVQVSSSTAAPGIDMQIVPVADIGLYGAVSSTLSAWTYASASNNRMPFVMLRKA